MLPERFILITSNLKRSKSYNSGINLNSTIYLINSLVFAHNLDTTATAKSVITTDRSCSWALKFTSSVKQSIKAHCGWVHKNDHCQSKRCHYTVACNCWPIFRILSPVSRINLQWSHHQSSHCILNMLLHYLTKYLPPFWLSVPKTRFLDQPVFPFPQYYWNVPQHTSLCW